MIDRIFRMLLEEARSRPGDDFFLKLGQAIQDLDVTICDFMIWADDKIEPPLLDEEELAKRHSPKYDRWLRKLKRRKERGPF